MKDCCGQEITPVASRLVCKTNRHPNTNGTSWGWIEGCTLNICWSNDHHFNELAAARFVNDYNAATTEHCP